MKLINDKYFWNPGHQSLVVDWTEQLGVSCQQIIGGWSSGLGVRDYLFGKEDNLSLADTRLDLLSLEPHSAVAHWQQTFPLGVLDALRGLKFRQAEVMALSASSEAATSLLLVNANLLLMWLNYCEEHRLSTCQRMRALGSGQAEIMAMMGLDSSRLALRMVKELSPDALSVDSTSCLQHLFSKPHILKRLTPSGKLNASLLEALDRWPWIAGYPIQTLLSQPSAILRESVKKVLSANHSELGVDAIEQLRQCRSISQVVSVEQAWSARWNLRKVLASLEPVNKLRVQSRPLSQKSANTRYLDGRVRLPILTIPETNLVSL